MIVDTFNRPDGDLGAAWTAPAAQRPRIVAQQVVSHLTGGAGFAFHSGPFEPTQGAELEFVGGTGHLGPAVRMSGDGTTGVVFSTGGVIRKYLAGAPTVVASGLPTWHASGSVGRLTVQGTTYTATIDGVVVHVAEITDAVYATGAAGFWISTDCAGDNWRATQYEGDSMSNVTDTYYPSEGFIGYGAQWMISQGGSPPVFVSVAQVDTIEFGEMTAGVINKTHLRSPGRAHEKIATIRDIGPFRMTGTLNLKHGSINNAGGDGFTSGGLIAIHRSLEERDMKFVLPDGSPGTEVPFRGVISKLKLGSLGLEELVKYEAEVQPLQDYTADLP